MSRRARSHRDWHPLLERCARFRVLRADADAIYDPADHHDRLWLGLHGMMSEAELHVLKQRMYQGKLNKTRRGALMGIPPIGSLRASGPSLPTSRSRRPSGGFSIRSTGKPLGMACSVTWSTTESASRSDPTPVPTGASWNGGDRTGPPCRTCSIIRARPASLGSATGKRIRRPEEGRVLIRDRRPASITWDRFQANPERLEANRARHDRPGRTASGASLRAGLLRCGRCGQRMCVRYSGAKTRPSDHGSRGTASSGDPLCQSLSGPGLDDLVAARVLSAVEPAALEASLAAVAGVERERAELARHGQLRRERACYEGDRAARQSQSCEPENRRVGRELERRWEETQRPLEDESERWQRTAPGRLSTDRASGPPNGSSVSTGDGAAALVATGPGPR
jgi:hypothetical protein